LAETIRIVDRAEQSPELATSRSFGGKRRSCSLIQKRIRKDLGADGKKCRRMKKKKMEKKPSIRLSLKRDRHDRASPASAEILDDSPKNLRGKGM